MLAPRHRNTSPGREAGGGGYREKVPIALQVT